MRTPNDLRLGLLAATACLLLAPAGAGSSPGLAGEAGQAILVPAGEVLVAPGGILEAEAIVIHGTLTAPAGQDLLVRASERLEVHGRILGAAPRADASLVVQATPDRLDLRGSKGADAPGVRLEAPSITVSEGGVVASARGADGTPVRSGDPQAAFPRDAAPRVHGRAGDGGAGGPILLQAREVRIAGRLDAGAGGDGGAALLDYGLAGHAIDVASFGGHGGPSGTVAVRADRVEAQAVAGPSGQAANGGDALSIAPQGRAASAECTPTALPPPASKADQGEPGTNVIGSESIDGESVTVDGEDGRDGCDATVAGGRGVDGQGGGDAQASGGDGADGGCAEVAAVSKDGGNGGTAIAHGGKGGDGGRGGDGADGHANPVDPLGVVPGPGTSGGPGGPGGPAGHGGQATARGGKGGNGAPWSAYGPSGCPNVLIGADGGTGGGAAATGGAGGTGGDGGHGGDGGDGCPAGSGAAGGVGGPGGNAGHATATGGMGGEGTGVMGIDGADQPGSTGYAPAGLEGQDGAEGHDGQEPTPCLGALAARTFLAAGVGFDFGDGLGLYDPGGPDYCLAAMDSYSSALPTNWYYAGLRYWPAVAPMGHLQVGNGIDDPTDCASLVVDDRLWVDEVRADTGLAITVSDLTGPTKVADLGLTVMTLEFCQGSPATATGPAGVAGLFTGRWVACGPVSGGPGSASMLYPREGCPQPSLTASSGSIEGTGPVFLPDPLRAGGDPCNRLQDAPSGDFVVQRCVDAVLLDLVAGGSSAATDSDYFVVGLDGSMAGWAAAGTAFPHVSNLEAGQGC